MLMACAECFCSGSCGQICVTVKNSAGTLISGGTITVKDGGGTTIGTCTTNGSGVCCVAIPSAATYTVTFTKTSYTSVTVSVVATCTTNNVTICTGTQVTFSVSLSCGVSSIGTSVSITGVGSGTVDGTGTWISPVPSPGTYSYTISRTGYATQTGTFTVLVNCGSATVSTTLVPDSTHNCCAGCSDKIIPTVLYLTDENGTWTLTSSLSGGSSCGIFTGIGSVTRNVANCSGPNTCVCNGSIQTDWDFISNGGSATIYYDLTLSYSFLGWLLTVGACYSTGPTACPTNPADCSTAPQASYHVAGPTVSGCVDPCTSGAARHTVGTAVASSTGFYATGSCSVSSVSLSATMSTMTYLLTPADGQPVSVGSAITITN